MAQDVTIAGASYSDVPSVTLPKTGGGTASFTDVTDTTAIASDVASGKYFFTASGVLTLGTSSGGGGGSVTQDQDGYLVLSDQGGGGGGATGLVYETGTFEPSSDVNQATITFADAHTAAPMYVQLCDTGETATDENSVLNFAIIDYRKMFGSGVNYGTSTTYGYAEWATKTSTSFTASNQRLTTGTDNSSNSLSPYYWATETGFRAYVNSSSRYFRANRTYKWIAVWAPEE